MLYAVIRFYDKDDYHELCYDPTNHDAIYEKIMKITDNDFEIASDAADWCELACEGESYVFRGGDIEIEDI